ncbi:MAG: hypothetical protein M3Y65_25045 [Pseudomonadota bacterium]|nr:hypothetical protein [Pseudomonadota bacterium]
MSNIIQFPTQVRVEDGALNADHPFLNSPLYQKMLKDERVWAPVAVELGVIAERGAGARCPDATRAVSLTPLRSSVKNRTRLADVFAALALLKPGFDGKVLTQFGVQICRWPFPGDPMLISVDLGQFSHAAKFYEKAKVENWRTAVAHDCQALDIVAPLDKLYHTAVAYFEIPTSCER